MFPSLRESIASKPLAPHLTYFRGSPEPGLDKLLACLAGSALYTLVLDRFRSPRQAEAYDVSKRIVRGLPQTCPHLQHLYLRYRVEEPERLSGAIGNLHNLRTLHIVPGNEAPKIIPRINPLLRRLSTLPFLSEFAMPIARVDLRDAPIADGFLRLRKLALERWYCLPEGALLQTMPPLPQLEQLTLRLPPFNPATSNFTQVYTSICSTSATTLTTIRLDLIRAGYGQTIRIPSAHALLFILQPLENLKDLEVTFNDVARFSDGDLLNIAELWPRLSKLQISWDPESDPELEDELAPAYDTVVDFVFHHPHLRELRLTSVGLGNLELERKFACGWRTWQVYGFWVAEDRIRDPVQLANILNILFPHLHAEPHDYGGAGVQSLWDEVMRELDRLWIEWHACSLCNNAKRRALR